MKLALIVAVCIIGVGIGAWLAYREPEVLEKIAEDVGEELLVAVVEAVV
jgi:hypothetical protein